MLDDSRKVPRKARSELLKAVHQASTRSAKVVHSEMKRGLGSLAAIVSTAPWVGVFGIVLGLCNFRGFNGSQTSILACVALTVSEAIVPCALGAPGGPNDQLVLQILNQQAGSPQL